MKPLPHGLSTSCKLLRVIDGDTVEVEVSRKVRVRLRDCWAPETRGEEAEQGKAARAFLEGLIRPGDVLTLFVPAGEDGELADAFTLGRALGWLWRLGDVHDLSARMCRAGFASPTKPPPATPACGP